MHQALLLLAVSLFGLAQVQSAPDPATAFPRPDGSIRPAGGNGNGNGNGNTGSNNGNGNQTNGNGNFGTGNGRGNGDAPRI